MGISVCDLLQTPFSDRTSKEKIQIMLEGKPRPGLQNKLDVACYDREHWLTACDESLALYCWPCLLFVAEQNGWNSSPGFRDYKHFTDSSIKHKKSTSHVHGMLLYQLFIHRNLRPVNPQPVVIEQTDFSKRNRDLAKRIVDVVCLAVNQQYPPSMDTKSYKPLNVEDCIDSLRLLKNFDMYNVTDDAINMLETFPKIVTDMVSAMASVLKAAIKEEVQLSTYVSLVMSEHSDIDLKSQLSTVLRYLKNGKVIERFIGFNNINQYKSSTVIHEYVSEIIEEYGFAERFVAHSCDGAVLASNSHLKTLKVKMRDDYPFCFFVPCHFHELDLVMEQSLSRNKECELFFKSMNSIKSFFRNNSEACKALNDSLGSSILDPDSNEWRHSKFFRVLKAHRKQFINFFESVVENYEECECGDIPKALGFQHILKDFETIFMLEAFTKLFDLINTLGETINSHLPESAFGSHLVENLTESLQRESENGFEDLWIRAVAETLEMQEPKPPSLKNVMEPETKLLHREFYYKIIDSIRMEIDVRFGSLQELMFFHNLNYEKHGKFVIANEYVQSLLAVHGPYFDESWIKNELRVLCSNNSVFAGKSIYELMELFLAANLRDTFKYLFKLAELILTIPCKPPSLPAGPSKLSEISVWSFVSENQENIKDLSLLCIESTFFEEVRNKLNFYSEVMLKFQEISNTVQFMYF